MANARHKIVHHLSQKADEKYGAENGWVGTVADTAQGPSVPEAGIEAPVSLPASHAHYIPPGFLSSSCTQCSNDHEAPSFLLKDV